MTRLRPLRFDLRTGAVPLCAALALLLACVAGYRASSWPLIHDAPLLHYVVFLMSKGVAPYRNIVEMNFPAAYMTEWFGMHTFGAGSRGWWAFDAAQALLLAAGFCVIAGKGNRSAGVLAASLVYLQHMQDGAANLGQRDWTAAIACSTGLACGVLAWRHRRGAWMLPAGFFLATAALIKPPMLLCGVVVVALLLREVRKAGESIVSYAALLSSGAAVALAMSLAFVIYWHAWGAFRWDVANLMPYYAGLGNARLLPMLPHVLPALIFARWLWLAWRL